MGILSVALLAFAVLGVFIRPRRIPNWVSPVLAAVAVVAFGGIDTHSAATAVHPLLAPLTFLMLAVPLAVMLDRIGFFESAAALLDTGRDPRLGLWLFAAAVTTFLNLDASVVLLTPLYIRIARRHGLDVKMLAFQPVLLASLASSALPISNLTNLIATSQLHLTAGQFLTRLALPTLVAITVGWFAYRRIGADGLRGERIADPVDKRALLIGAPVVVLVVLGFTFGGMLHIPAWAIAAVADAYLLTRTRSIKLHELPFGAAALAAGLGVAAAAAVPTLGVAHLFHDGTAAGQVRIAFVSMAGASLVNNLPTTLVGVSAITAHVNDVWPLLFGANKGPILMLHGSLAGLLWRDTARRLDVEVTPWQYTRVGVMVGVPSIALSLATLVILSELLK